MGKAGTYVELMTGPINGRDFPKRYKTEETDEYMEYKFKNDDETFRISNNMYHVLLQYSMNTHKGYEVSHNATLDLGTPTFDIPYLGTITAGMLA